MEDRQLVCLQVHNDYQILGGETKSAHLIADLLERNGIRVIRYYKTNMEYAGESSIIQKLRNGFHAINNPDTTKEIEGILEQNHVDFALVHNVVSVISNAAYKVLIKKDIPIIKYLQNYNLVCLNGALDHEKKCEQCQSNNLIGVKCKCYKNSIVYSFIKFLIKRDMDKHVLQHISAFMPNSEFVMKEHVRWGIDSGKMHVMYNYVDIPLTQFNGSRDYYLYFGRLTGEKGVMTAIRAFEKMPEKELIIMGSGTLEEEIKHISDKNSNIEFIGNRQGLELIEIIAKAKAVIVPSEWDEPLPRTILEAYSQGTPVIGSNRGGIPELIDNGVTGYVFKAGDNQDLYEKVKHFDKIAPEDYSEMRNACLKTLSEKYTEKAYFQRFMTCIREIV